FARLARQMKPGKTPEGMDPRSKKEFVPEFDFEFDEKHKTVSVTEQGVAKAERFVGIQHLYRAENGHLVNHLHQSLKAESLYKRDVDYAVIDGEVKIIDEFTGRILDGRRWSEGLHQAVEAKEVVRVREENQTLATITLQNYFRMYDKLSGMSGTALTEATEFMKIYKVGVAEIVAEAGRPGAVTIATNMAGRGVDIQLGGNPEHLTQLEMAKLGLKPGDPDYEERFKEILPPI